MKNENIQILNNFTLDNIPDLDIAVLGALELFAKKGVPHLSLNIYKRPLVIGSGNAEAIGRIIFEKFDAVLASESNYKEKLQYISNIDGVIIISASGGKHAPIIADYVKKQNKPIKLITCNANAEAIKIIGRDNTFVFPKNREPYTYNTSTYMAMILGETKENPKDIWRFIKEDIDSLDLPDFSLYDKYFFIVPPKFSNIIRMFQVKFIELFGRMIARDVETSEYMKHAVTVVPANELFISFGWENNIWGSVENRLNIPLPQNAGYAAIMAIGYYIIGKIQKSHPPYFKENLVKYTQKVSKIFDQNILPIVE